MTYIPPTTMNPALEKEYQEYLDYMYEYDEKNGYYPTHLSNGQWTPFSSGEYVEKTKNGTVKLYFPDIND